VDTVRSLTTDTAESDWNSVAVCSDGSYGVEEGLICSFPVRTRSGKWEIAQGVSLNEFGRAKTDASVAELKEEKALVSELIGLCICLAKRGRLARCGQNGQPDEPLHQSQ
jgi:malate dehydrogenase